MREKIRVGGDVPTFNILDMIENDFQAKYNGRLEFDRMEKKLNQTKTEASWYMDTLDDDVKRLVMKNYLSNGNRDIERSVLEVFRDLFPIDQESIELTRQRVLGIQREAVKFAGAGKHIIDPSRAKDAKLGLVGHSMFFKLMNTDKRYWEGVYDLED